MDLRFGRTGFSLSGFDFLAQAEVKGGQAEARPTQTYVL